MGYNPCLDDPNLWMRLMNILIDGFEHYDRVLIYIKGLLAIVDYPTEVLHKIDNYFFLKPGYLSYPNFYFGSNLKRMRMDNGLVAWSLIP